MTSLRLCWPIFVLWNMWWGTTPHLVSAQMSDAMFKLEKGIRYQGGVMARRSARSKLQCAAECAQEKSCFGYNFGFRQCELLSRMASGRTNNAPGWTHGYYPTGKYHTRHREYPVCLKASWAKKNKLYCDISEYLMPSCMCFVVCDISGAIVCLSCVTIPSPDILNQGSRPGRDLPTSCQGEMLAHEF